MRARPESGLSQRLHPACLQFGVATESLGQNLIGLAGGGWRWERAEQGVGEMQAIAVGQPKGGGFNLSELGHGAVNLSATAGGVKTPPAPFAV
jgi:hypothetical protein